MAMTNINIRVDEEVKATSEALFETLGLNMSTAINLFLRQSIREGGLPFAVRLDPLPQITPVTAPLDETNAKEQRPAPIKGNKLKKELGRIATVTETEQLLIYSFTRHDLPCRIAFTKKKAGKRVKIHASDNQVMWEDQYPLGILPVSEMHYVGRPADLLCGGISVFVISGKPGMIAGLDEGILASAKALSLYAPRSGKCYLMSEAAFDELEF